MFPLKKWHQNQTFSEYRTEALLSFCRVPTPQENVQEVIYCLWGSNCCFYKAVICLSHIKQEFKRH